MGGNIINSVVKTLNLVELLDQCGEMGVTEIANKMGFEKSMVYRMLSTLKSKRYVSQNPVNLKYSNSYKFYELGQNAIHRAGLPKMALRFMNELAEVVPYGSINLAVRDALEAVYIEKIESKAAISVCMKRGQSLPLYCSSVGKALLMHQPEDKLRHLLNSMSLKKITPNTIDSVERLLSELQSSKRRGFAIDNEEHLPGIRCVASPVFNSRGLTIAALGIASPSMSVESYDQLYEQGKAVSRSASDFTNFLGGFRL